MKSVLPSSDVWINNEDNLYTRLKKRRRGEMEIPNCLGIDRVLEEKKLRLFSDYLDSLQKDGRLTEGWKNRKILLYSSGTCTIQNSDLSIIWSYKQKHDQILKAIVCKAIEAVIAIDGEKAYGDYDVKLFVQRDYGKHNDDIGLEELTSMHHDYVNPGKDATKKWNRVICSEIPEYLFCSVLTDANDKKNGWKGGHLIVQSDHSKNMYVEFDQHRPYIDYAYPVNKGICFRNKEAVHARTGMKSTMAKRDLLTVQLFKQ